MWAVPLAVSTEKGAKTAFRQELRSPFKTVYKKSCTILTIRSELYSFCFYCVYILKPKICGLGDCFGIIYGVGATFLFFSCIFREILCKFAS